MAPFGGTGVQDDDEVISELLEEDEASAERRRKRDWIRKFMQSSIVRGAAATAIVLLLSWLAVRRRKRLNQRQRKQYENAASVPLSLLIRMVQEGTLEKILISTSRIFFRDGSSSAWSKIDLPANTALQNKIYSLLARSKADISTIPEVDYVSQISTAAFAVLPFVYLALVYRMMNRQFGGDSNSTKGVVRKHQNVTFRDVAGIDSVVQEVQEIVDYLKDPRRYHSVGATTPSGVLLYGPPGTGKTLLAQAVAGEASVDCFLACSASDFVELYVGRGASRIRALFQTVRREATRNRRRWWNLWKDPDEHPCSAILFIDELDALAKTRSSLGSNDEREQTLNQLLTEMDGFQHSKEEVTIIVMAASNRADVLDPAILRRFDRRVHVGYPDVKGREAILRVHARRVALSDPIDWESLAELSTNLSGVDLRNAVNEAALLAVRDDSRVCHGHLEQAILRVKRMKELVSSAV